MGKWALLVSVLIETLKGFLMLYQSLPREDSISLKGASQKHNRDLFLQTVILLANLVRYSGFCRSRVCTPSCRGWEGFLLDINALYHTWYSILCDRGKFCLDLMARGKKLASEYSKRWVPGSFFQGILNISLTCTTPTLPVNSSPLKSKRSTLLIHQLWQGPEVWFSPSSALQDRLQWLLLLQCWGTHSATAVHSRGGH